MKNVAKEASDPAQNQRFTVAPGVTLVFSTVGFSFPFMGTGGGIATDTSHTEHLLPKFRCRRGSGYMHKEVPNAPTRYCFEHTGTKTTAMTLTNVDCA